MDFGGETGITEDRMKFLKDLLETNKFEVKIQKENEIYTIGVTDIIFNPVIAVYESKLKTKNGKIVSPAFYRQETNKCDSRYWMAGRK